MLKNCKTVLSVLFLLVTIGLFSSCGSKEEAKQPTDEAKAQNATLLNNLTEAFQGESNASNRYQEFAKKADEEGYKAVAAMFRAASKAEAIHAKNHQVVINKLGGSVQAKLEKVDVKTTKENLQKAIDGETYEFTKMYPQFVENARKANEPDAIKTLNGAMETEKIHSQLYTTALNNLDNWKEAKDFFVCPVCGFTTENGELAKCPICSTPKEKFETIK